MPLTPEDIVAVLEGRGDDLEHVLAVPLEGRDPPGRAGICDGELRQFVADLHRLGISDNGIAQRLQVGAYRDRDNARRIARQLEDAGIDDVSIEDVRTDAGKVWRVRIGPLAPAAVDGVLARIRGLGLPSPRVFSH